MKTNLFKREESQCTSLLIPQKWLLCLLTLLVTFVGSGRMWAAEYVINNASSVDGGHEVGKSVFNVSGTNISITNDKTKTISNGSNNGVSGLKFSKSVTYTVTLPETEIVKNVVFTGYGNTTSQGYIKQINGIDRSDVAGHEFPAKANPQTTGTYEVPFNVTLKNSFTFMLDGSESVLSITITTEPAQTYSVSVLPQSSDFGESTLPSIPEVTIKNASTGANIASGSQVVKGTRILVSAPDYTQEYRFHFWKENTQERWTWGSSFEYEVTGDVVLKPQYCRNYLINATTNIGVAATVSNTNDGKVYSSTDLIGRTTGITVTAPVMPGYDFKGWAYTTYYNNGAKASESAQDGTWKNTNTFNLTLRQSEFGLNNTDKTSLITNPSFENGNLTGWATTTLVDGEGNEITNPDTGVKGTSTDPYTVTNGNGSYLFNTWSPTGPANGFDIYQTISNLPAGTYRLSALLASDKDNRISLYAMNAGNTIVQQEFTMANANNTMQECSILFTLTETKDVTIVAKSNTWFKADNFKLALVNEAFNVTFNAIYEQKSGDFAGDYTDVNGTGYYTLYGNGSNALAKTVILDVPFIKMTFGNGTQQVSRTDVAGITTSSINMNNGAPGVVFPSRIGQPKLPLTQYQKRIPESGTFYKFEPELNGLLYIHGFYASDDTHPMRAWLIDATTANIVDAQLYFGGLYDSDPHYANYTDPNNIIHGAYEVNTTDGVPVLGGHTYYLFSSWFDTNDYENDLPAGSLPSDATKFETVFHLSSFGFKPAARMWDFTTNYSGTIDGWTPINKAQDGFIYNTDGTEGSLAKQSSIEFSWTEGLYFGGTRLYKNDRGAHLLNNGFIRIPVKANETVILKNLKSAGSTVSMSVTNGNISTIDEIKDAKDVSIVAQTDGYLIVQNNGNIQTWIDKIIVTDALVFDENEISASTNSSFTNPIISSIPSGYTVAWSSSDPTVATVDASGHVSTTGIEGSIMISAVATSADKKDQIAGCYVLNVSDMHFEDVTPSMNLAANGTATYNQQVVGAPDYAQVKYEVLYNDSETTNKNVVLTQNENEDNYSVTVTGTGKVKVQASVGNIKCTYVLTVSGAYYDEVAYILRGNATSFTAPTLKDIPNGKTVTYRMHTQDTSVALESAQVNPSNGDITNIPRSNRSTDGGVIVVEAVIDDNVVAAYCLTVPMDLRKWNFYREGQDAAGNPSGRTPANDVIDSPLKFGSAVNYKSPNSAAIVTPIDGELDDKIDPIRADKKDSEALLTHLKKRRHWKNLQNDVRADKDIYGNWDYTFKTLSSEKIDNVFRMWYANEPLLSYKQAVKGDNGRVIQNTAGLVFDCAANRFGVNDNITTQMWEGDPSRNDFFREGDRAVLAQAGSKITIPEVPVGRYIRILWYRHSDNSGDKFNVTNAIDLDGKPIDPDHDIRFTGSSYRHGYYGATIFKVAADPNAVTNGYSDVTITIANQGWTEFYTVEILDKYDTDFKLAQINVWENSNHVLTSGTSDDYARDINDPDEYNSQQDRAAKIDNVTYKPVSRLASRIATHAKGAVHITDAQDFYISGYAPHCRGWNGWLNLSLAAENVEGTASCQTVSVGSDENYNGVEGMIPNEHILIGSALHYTLPHMQQIRGTGTMKLVFRTHSGWGAGEIADWNSKHPNNTTSKEQEHHYTLNKQEAWIAMGEYSVQEYPYTWDFTKYNMDRENAYNSGFVTLTKMADGSMNIDNQYGSWNGEKAIQVNELQTATIGESSSTSHIVQDYAKRNKRFFAQTSQLTIGDNADRKYTILETEGLRFRLNDGIKDAGDGDVKFVAAQSSGSKQRKAWGDAGQGWTSTYLDVNNVTITIPEVQKGMFVFVKSDSKPTNVTGAVDTNPDNTNIATTKIHTITDESTWTSGEVSMEQQDVKTGVWVYEQTTDGKQDVSITVSGKIEAIGVTDIFKILTVAANKDKPSWMTESRAERVDYNNNELFTNHKLTGYISTVKTTKVGDENKDCGTLNLVKKQVIDSKNNVSGNKGLVMSDETSVSITASGDQTTTRNIVPLFVPACNIPNDDISGNLLIDAIDGLANLPASTNDCYNYILTNTYWNASLAEGLKGDRKIAEDINFYIVRQAGPLRKNSAYFSMNPASAANVRNFYLVFGEEDDVVGIEQIGNDDAEVTDNPEVLTIHTLNGMKLNGLPTQRGIYIINGKKVLVK